MTVNALRGVQFAWKKDEKEDKTLATLVRFFIPTVFHSLPIGTRAMLTTLNLVMYEGILNFLIVDTRGFDGLPIDAAGETVASICLNRVQCAMY
jgi:hypothetical protein